MILCFLFAFTYTEEALIFSVAVEIITSFFCICSCIYYCTTRRIKTKRITTRITRMVVQYNHAKAFTSKNIFCASLIQLPNENFHKICKNLGWNVFGIHIQNLKGRTARQDVVHRKWETSLNWKETIHQFCFLLKSFKITSDFINILKKTFIAS